MVPPNVSKHNTTNSTQLPGHEVVFLEVQRSSFEALSMSPRAALGFQRLLGLLWPG
jgi:hypothetical protein